jgi:hypothetical protein
MSKSVGRLSILLIEGKDFFSFDGPNKTSDPYVEFRAGQFKHVSKAATKTLTPLWKEKFELDYEGDSDNIYFFVYDKNILSSPFYGVAHYPIACLDRTQKNDLWVKIPSYKGKEPLIHMEITFTPMMKVLAVEGRDLIAVDKNGKSDPYLEMALDKHTHTTGVKNDTLAPVWNQSFEFYVTGDVSTAVLKLHVWDKDLLKSKDMGVGTLNLNTLKIGQNECNVVLSTKGTIKLIVEPILFGIGYQPQRPLPPPTSWPFVQGFQQNTFQTQQTYNPYGQQQQGMQQLQQGMQNMQFQQYPQQQYQQPMQQQFQQQPTYQQQGFPQFQSQQGQQSYQSQQGQQQGYQSQQGQQQGYQSQQSMYQSQQVQQPMYQSQQGLQQGYQTQQGQQQTYQSQGQLQQGYQSQQGDTQQGYQSQQGQQQPQGYQSQQNVSQNFQGNMQGQQGGNLQQTQTQPQYQTQQMQ